MTLKELKTQVESFACPRHGKPPVVQMVNSKLQITRCCCPEWRKKLRVHINVRMGALPSAAEPWVKRLRSYIDAAKIELAKPDGFLRAPSLDLRAAKRAYLRIDKDCRQVEPVPEMKALLDEAMPLAREMDMREKEFNKKETLRRLEQQAERAHIAIEKDKERKEYEKALKNALAAKEKQEAKELERRKQQEIQELAARLKEQEAQKRARQFQAEEEEKEREKFIAKHIAEWERDLATGERFSEEYRQRSKLASLAKEDIQNVSKVHYGLLEKLSSIRSANRAGMLRASNALYARYESLLEKLNDINVYCSQQLAAIEKSNRTRNQEKQRDNRREDAPFFRKMVRLYEDKIKPTDTWYENESRRFSISMDDNYMTYLEAYGRIIRGNLAKAEIVFDGEEDIDRWGYFGFWDKCLPFCLREISVTGNMITYHLYTFNNVLSIKDYDYDEAITDRIVWLNARGIKTN